MLSRNEIVDAIQSALKEGAVDTASFLLAHLKDSDQAPQLPTVEQSTLTLTPDVAKPGEIYAHCCEFLRTLLVGQSFTFHQVADYIQSRPKLLGRLNMVYNESERRERWRNQVSSSIDKLRAKSYVGKGKKSTEYYLICHP